MALGIIGDIHGELHVLSDIVKETAPYDNVVANIQVGDMGIDKSQISHWQKYKWNFAKPTYFIDGNHEDFDLLNYSEVTEILPNLFYVPRGTIMQLDGRIVAFLGGAASIDYKIRLEYGYDWDLRENILPEQVERFYTNLESMGTPKVDLLVTHVPPQYVIDKYFDNYSPIHKMQTRRDFGAPLDWMDPNAKIIEDIWNKLGQPQMVCGHMHKHVEFENESHVMAEFGFLTV